jgi:hypothetical protein
MRLHRNAALSLKGRELLVERVLGQSWLLGTRPRRRALASELALSGWRAIALKDPRD